MTTAIAHLNSLREMRDEKKPLKFHELITVIYGDKKVGKSTAASRYKNPLFLDCEDALRSVVDGEGKNVLRAPISAWSDILNITDMLGGTTPEESGIDTVVVDGMQEAYQYLRSYVLSKYGVEHENEGVLAYGKGKGIIAGELRTWFIKLRKLTELGYGVVITAHSRIVEMENNGVSYDKKVPFVSGGKEEWGWESIKPSVDLIVYAYKKETRAGSMHVMCTKGTQLYEASDPTPDGRLPQDVPFSYAELEKAYNSKQ